MKNVIVVGLTDTYSFRIIEHLENDSTFGTVRRMYTSLQFFRDYKRGDADIVVMDSIPDSYPVDFGKKLRQIDPEVFIIRLFQAEDAKLERLFKEAVSNTASMSKLNYSKDEFNKLLSSDGSTVSTAPKWQWNSGNVSSQRKSAALVEKAVGKTVLVVDDFENTLNVVKHSLDRIGFNVISATSAKEALQMLSKSVLPNIIITDLNMPQIDGFGFIEQIRTMPALQKVPIFILTTEFNLAKKIKAKELNIAGWIQKPYKTEEFVKIITKFLE